MKIPFPVSQVDNVNRELHRTSTNVKLLENSRRPFYRLHPDIIIEISKYLDPRACDKSYEPLLSATQTCRNWRNTLISQPSLWSFISGTRPDLIPCLLNRSKHAPLDAHIPSHRVREVVRHINPYVDRLSSIHFDLVHSDDSVFQALYGLNAAPKLCRLNIEFRVPLLGPLIYTPGIAKPIPSLHQLQLFGFPITPELIQLSNLTVVDLDAAYTTRSVVLHLLSRNPLLEVVRLWGKHSDEELDEDDSHPPGSVTLPHLRILSLELTPLVLLEALSPPHGARIFSGFARGAVFNYDTFYTTSSPIPGSFSNLQDLRKLRVVDQGEIYIKLEGEKGSVTYCISRDPFIPGTYSGVPLEKVTDAIYQISPLFRHPSHVGPTTSQLTVSRMVCDMVRLQKLELSCCSVKELDYFLLVLHSTRVCKDLRVLVLSHCVDLYRKMRSLAMLAEGRRAADMGLDIVRITCPNVGQLKVTLKQEDVTRLERAVGSLEYVELAELGRPGQSSLRFDPEIGINQPYIFF